MTPMQPLLSSTLGERNKRRHDGLKMNMKLGSILKGLRKHKVDKVADVQPERGVKMRDEGGNKLLFRTGSVNNEWLGLWKVPQQNPFNMYGTLPSKTRCRDKRKAFSVPPLEDLSANLSQDGADIAAIIEASKFGHDGPDSLAHCIDAPGRRMMVPPSLEMQRISTILSDPKSGRTSVTASTARSTIDSFRFSDPFDDCVIQHASGEPHRHLERLLNNLYIMTQNGFLSGSLLENPRGHKDQVDAEFIAMTLARRHGENPCLRLLQELDEISTLPPKHRRSQAAGSMNSLNNGKFFRNALLNGTDHSSKLSPTLGPRVPKKDRMSLTRGITSNKFEVEFQVSSAEEMLLWNASTDIAKETIRRSGIVQRPVKYDLNDDFMVTDADDYAVLQTRFGRIVYSPKFSDGRYMYRFVILTKEAQEAVEALSRTSPKQGRLTHTESSGIPGKRFLTEFEIVRQLGIQMSPGWEHFIYFKSCQKELVLRKRI